MLKIFKSIRISNFPKNLLIIFPLIVSGKLNFEIYKDTIISSLFIFFLITSICYLINDYSDQKIDKKNKLKINLNLTRKTFFIYLVPLVFSLCFSLYYLNQTSNYFLYLYILNFFAYNFFGKNFKYIDILLLTNFYLLRIMYGAQVFELELSIVFILFSFSLFLCLCIIKRLTQIKINNLLKNNLLIAYNKSDQSLLKLIFNVSFFLNVVISSIYYIYNLDLLFYKNNLFLYINQFSKEKISLFYFVYIFFMSNILFNYVKNKINRDVYSYFISNKINLFLIFISFIIFLY
jgi:4-hydroxybenzoate polyprenyltransferase